MIDLIIIVVLSVVLVPLAGFSSGAFRVVLGLIFALFSPGYSLIAALFPRKTSLDTITRITLSFGMSIAVVPLIGLVLNYTPWGIRLWPILISVFVFILVLSAVAWFRRRGFSDEEQFHPRLKFRLDSLKRSWAEQGLWSRIINLLLAASFLVTIGTLIFVISNPKVGERFTEFFILSDEGKMESYPGEIILGESVSVLIGITNHEHEQATYRIEILIDGHITGTAGPIVLEHEETWEENINITPINAGENQKTEFQLFKEGITDPGPYRSLHLWVDVVKD